MNFYNHYSVNEHNISSENQIQLLNIFNRR